MWKTKLINDESQSLKYMMNKFRIFLWTFATVCLFSACEEEKASHWYDSEELLSFDVSTLEDKEYEIKLSDLMESVEIVQLDNSTEEAFGRTWDVEISDNYIATGNVAENVKLYHRKSGKYIGNVGKRGQGPGEYTNIWDITINEEDKRIYLWPNMRDYIYSYDMNGKFIEEETILLPEGYGTRGTMFPDRKTNELVVLGTPYGYYQRENITHEGKKVACWVQDFQGNLKFSIPADNYTIPRGSSHSWASHPNRESSIYSYTLRTIKSEMRRDTVYHYHSKDNLLYPVYTTNYPHEDNYVIASLESPLHYYTVHATYKKRRSTNPENLEGYKVLQVDKKTLAGKYIRVVNDYLGNIPIILYDFLFSVKNEYATIIYDPLDLKEQLEEALDTNTEMSEEVRKRVVSMKNSLTEDDNDILVICKFKSR